MNAPRNLTVDMDIEEWYNWKMKTSIQLCCLGIVSLAVSVNAAVEFPGRAPGMPGATLSNGVLVLQNNVIAARWDVRGGTVRPLDIRNKIDGRHYLQQGTELFRVATNEGGGLHVGVRIETNRIVVLASVGGIDWTVLASFPRTNCPGEPKLIRVGKMNRQAQARDFDGAGGPTGMCVLADIRPRPAGLPTNRFELVGAAHRAAAVEFAFPTGAVQVSCRIEKGTDVAESWSPALAVVWGNGAQFVLVGVRHAKPVFNVTTPAGEQIVTADPGSGAVFSLAASSCRLDDRPLITTATLPTPAVRVADSIPGAAVEARLVSPSGMQVRWRAELREGSSYIRQIFSFSAGRRGMGVKGIELVAMGLPDAAVVGTCPGSPVVGSGMFLGVEMPGTWARIVDDKVRIGFDCELMMATQVLRFASVVGVVPSNQVRRGFLFYLERERARASRPFLHYNCWYDLGFDVNEKGMLDVIAAFDGELRRKRGVPVESFVIDDGWDDASAAPWEPDQRKFPHGFDTVKTALYQAESHLGMWISPQGGYGGAEQRTTYFRELGVITNTLDLAEPGYCQWFRNRCIELMRRSGVNYFKWDKAGEGVTPHFMALLGIARDLRAANPEVFVNVTVGTWPSPFWLHHVDCTWRNGSADVGWAGKGDDREQWITFRDGYCRKMFVDVAPLYPLNAAMHHGIVHGRCFQGEKVGKAGNDLKNEARSYFASGVMLQELYLTPSMMTSDAWDRVAESAKWARANAEVLLDAHWVGGDPLALEPYGYAAWSPRKGTLMVRNPADVRTTIMLDAAIVFDLPPGVPGTYALTAAYQDQRVRSLTIVAGTPTKLELEPFEVLVFNAWPRAGGILNRASSSSAR